MIRIAVCDDEQHITDKIEQCILKYGEDNNIDFQITKFKNGKILIDSQKHFDLIFLDIQMGENDEGITTAQRIRLEDMDTHIVFATGFPNFSMQAHSVHAFDFIEKPFEYMDIERVLNDFRRIGEKRRNKVIELKTVNGAIVQPIDEIIYIMVTNKRRELYLYVTSQENKISIKGNLSDIYSRLDSNQFFIPHRSYVINLDRVYLFNGSNSIIMSNGDDLPLTRDNREKFKEQMHKYVSEKGALLK